MMFFIRRKFPLKAEADITKKLSLYVKAGLPLPEALGLLAGQMKTKSHIETMVAWQTTVENGRTLAQAFDISDTYGSKYVAVSGITKLATALGDKSGSLADSLLRSSHHLNKKITLRKKVTNAAAYPIAVLVGTLGLVAGLILFIFPKIIPLFESLKVTLPISTRILIALSNILLKYWLILVVLVFISVAFLVSVMRFSKSCSRWVQYLLLRLPFVGGVIELKQVSVIFDCLQTLTEGGEQLSEALKTISNIPSFYEYQKFLTHACEEVSQGRPLANFVREHKNLFPTYISGVLSAGERTGNIESAIRDVADIVQSELDDLIRVLTATIEPVLMVSMSLLIGFIALSIILPIYGITSHFQNG